MATKQSTFGIGHATVVPSNYRPDGDAEEGTGTKGPAAPTDE